MNYLIANPVAGRGRCRESLNRIECFFRGLDQEYELALTKDEGHATELACAAAKNGASTIYSIGGDGTFVEVLNGVYDKDVTLGVIPAGTGNDFARTIGLSLNLDQALQQLRDVAVKSYDLGQAQDGVFAAVCGVGFAVDVMEYVNNHRDGFLKGPFAIGAAVYNTIRKLRAEPVRITIDGEVIETEAIIAGVHNTPYTGGGMMLTPNADPTDGLLEVLIVAPASKFEVLRLLPKVYKGGHVGHRLVTILQGKEVKIEADQPMAKIFDGNVSGTTPIEARVLPGQIKVLTPRR